jgi:hypothetical protein
MGRRDFRKRESKKPKKGAKKAASISVLQPQTTVEVVKKGKKEREEE